VETAAFVEATGALGSATLFVEGAATFFVGALGFVTLFVTSVGGSEAGTLVEVEDRLVFVDFFVAGGAGSVAAAVFVDPV
jgi:hypothetical protein